MKTFGYIIIFTAAMALGGCDKQEGSFAKQAGAKVGEAVTDFASGVGSGVDTKLTVPVEISPKLRELGLAHTVAKSSLDAAIVSKGIAVYFVAKQKLSCVLVAKALNKDNVEIGRCTTEMDFEADDAKYVNFVFPREMDSALVAKYEIDYKGPKPPANASRDSEKGPEVQSPSSNAP